MIISNIIIKYKRNKMKKVISKIIDKYIKSEKREDDIMKMFEEQGIEKSLKVLRQIMSRSAGYDGKDFFENQALKYFDNCCLIMKYLDAKGGKVDLGTFMDSTEIEAHIIQAIPPQDATLPELEQSPNAEEIKSNNLGDYEAFWIPPTYGLIEGRSYSEQILFLCNEYGFNIDRGGVKLEGEEVVPQISAQLQQQIGGYANVYIREGIRRGTGVPGLSDKSIYFVELQKKWSKEMAKSIPCLSNSLDSPYSRYEKEAYLIKKSVMFSTEPSLRKAIRQMEKETNEVLMRCENEKTKDNIQHANMLIDRNDYTMERWNDFINFKQYEWSDQVLESRIKEIEGYIT
jgi:hypothetical protein